MTLRNGRAVGWGRHRGALVAAALATTLGAGACTGGERSGSRPPAADAAADAAPRRDAAADVARDAADATDAAGGADADARPAPLLDCVPDGSASAATCPADLPGPALVRIESPTGCPYCMDATEITSDDYAAFLAAPGADERRAAQDPWCTWNDSFAPVDALGGRYAVRADWCDAAAYCRWAGKRLCGRIGGGTLDADASVSAEGDEWYNACSAGGSRLFSYGDDWVWTACSVAGQGVTFPAPVASFPGCEGGFPGLFDLTGSETEWVDQCRARAGKVDACLARGLAYDAGGSRPALPGCGRSASAGWAPRWYSGGFRCCADAR